MSNQLVKKNPAEGYQNVFPKTWIDAIKDKESGVSLQEILQGFNMYFLSYNGSRALTRCKVPSVLRKEGLWITYVLYDHTVVTEWYNSDQIDDNSWSMDSNWRIASNNLVGDVSVSADGYWVINGEKTEAKAQGEQGVTPLLRVGANNKLQVSYNVGKVWKDISDYIVPRFRYTRGATNDTAGIIQISMDLGKTWTNLSNEITNNLRISRYIGINESLPTSGIAEGTIYMKGPYYGENDTLNKNPLYRMWVYAWKGNTLEWQDNGEFTSISTGVVQERGTSTTEVMSQDAVTRELTKLESEVSQLGQQVIYDVTLNNNGATFASLSALLSDANLATLIPASVRCGGMSIRFVQSPDNKYVQYRLVSDSFTADINKWECIDEYVESTKNLNQKENIELSKDNGVVLTSIEGEEIPNNENDMSICDDYGNEVVNISPELVKINKELKVKGKRPLYKDDIDPNELDAEFQSIKTDISNIQGDIVDINERIQNIDGVTNVKVINSVTFPQASIQILSNVDQGVSTYEDINVGYSNILKISDSTYYLYYSGMGTELGIGDTNQRLLFAYSTDGFTYTRGFPQGVTPPVSGTNLIANFNLREQHIFKVCDSEYPYRMIANDDHYNMMMYKSTDAIHFDFEHGKKCCIGSRDCQVSAIVRGQTIKLYVRGWRKDNEHPLGTRAVTIAYCDIDGNIIAPTPSWALPYNSLYQASASVLDDHREILFPTFYNDPNPTTIIGGMGGDDSMSLKCYIVNQERSDEVSINTANVQTSDDKAIYVMPNTVDINNDLYILVNTENRTHNAPYTNARSYLKLAKITLGNI